MVVVVVQFALLTALVIQCIRFVWTCSVAWFSLSHTSMSFIDGFRYFFSGLSLPVLAALIGIFAWRRLYRKFPLFFSYIIITALVTISRFLGYSMMTQRSYAYLFWISSIVASVFAIMAVSEIFLGRLFVGFFHVQFYRYLFPIAFFVIILCAILTALFAPDKWAMFGVIDRVLTVARAALLGFFVALMLAMGRQWTRYELAIGFGFGIHAAASFFTSAMWVQPRYRNGMVNDLPRIAWDIACIIWLVAFGRIEKATDGASTIVIDPDILNQTQRMEKTLKDWLTFKRR